MKTSNKCGPIEWPISRLKNESNLPVLNTHITTHHSPENLHALVSDIESYPSFIKWIKAMRVTNTRQEGGISYKLGEVLIGFKGFSERFATNVASDAVAKTVTTTLVRGPFRRLRNAWAFIAAPEGGTRVNFHIDYEFSNPVLAMVARSQTDKAVQRIMDAFINEADRRYDSTQPSPTRSFN